MKELNINNIYFVGEQDGEVEKKFKKRMSAFLVNHSSLTRAYLAQVKYQLKDNNINVVLCIASSIGEDILVLNQAIKIFKSMFNSQAHLDILFLSAAQEQKLRKLCTTFFISDSFIFQSTHVDEN